MQKTVIGICGAMALVLCGCGDRSKIGTNSQSSSTLKTLGLTEFNPCQPDASGTYANASSVIAQSLQTENGHRATGGGCVFYPLAKVWAATQTGPVVTWQESDLNSMELEKDENTTLFFRSEHSAGPHVVLLRQAWEMEWTHKVTKGSRNAPQEITIAFEKPEGQGSRHIHFWTGQILLKALSENVTSFSMINEVKGTKISQETSEDAVSEFLERLRKECSRK